MQTREAKKIARWESQVTYADRGSILYTRVRTKLSSSKDLFSSFRISSSLKVLTIAAYPLYYCHSTAPSSVQRESPVLSVEIESSSCNIPPLFSCSKLPSLSISNRLHQPFLCLRFFMAVNLSLSSSSQMAQTILQPLTQPSISTSSFSP
jgi:hypothetical protein